MPTARTRANRKYNEKAYDRLAITIPKGRKADLEAKLDGKAINALVNELLMDYLEMSKDEWSAKAPSD